MATFKQKVEHLSSMKRIINERLEKKESEYRIGFTFKSTGEKSLYKVDKDGKLCANLGNFVNFDLMVNYLNGFYNALMF